MWKYGFRQGLVIVFFKLCRPVDSYYFALIAQGIEFNSEVICAVVSKCQTYKLYFIEGDIEEPFKERETVCVFFSKLFL